MLLPLQRFPFVTPGIVIRDSVADLKLLLTNTDVVTTFPTFSVLLQVFTGNLVSSVACCFTR